MSINGNPASSTKTPGPAIAGKDKTQLWKWLLAIIIPLIVYFIPLTGVDAKIKVFLVITLWAVISMATEILPSALIGILLPVFYILFKVAKPADAFSPWTSTVIWISLGGIILANILMTSGLAKRIAYFTIVKTGGTFTGTLMGIMLAGLIINPFIPSVMGKMAIIVPIAIGICQILNLEPKSRGASAIMLTAFLAIATPRLGYLTGDGGIPMAMNLVSQVTKSSVSWGQFAFHNLIISIIFSAISVAIVIFALKPEKELESKEAILRQWQELGPMMQNEKKVAVLLVVTLLFLITDSFHKINAAWIFIIIGAICFLPGVNLIDEKQMGKLNYGILFFIAGCMSIGTIAAASGVFGK